MDDAKEIGEGAASMKYWVPPFSKRGDLRGELDKDRETFASFYRLPLKMFKFYPPLHNRHPSSNGKWLVSYKLRRFNICFLTRACMN